MTTYFFHGVLPRTILTLAFWMCSTAAVRAQVITVNGGFESGFTGWTIANQLGSDGAFFLQSGTLSPVSGSMVPAPPSGIQAAMSDAQGPGAHVLYQDVVIPTFAIASAQLRFDLFVGNRANAFFNPSPATLDFSTPALNQQARIDILTGSSDPFSVAASDVLLNTFQTVPGNPLVSGYNTIDLDVTSLLAANAGNTLRLRFAEVDNVSTFQLGVDNVSLAVMPVPEPASALLCGIGAFCLFCRRIVRVLRQRETPTPDFQA